MAAVYAFIVDVILATGQLALEASIYILFGILVAGLLKMFLSPHFVARQLGEGRVGSVVRAALLGIPIPLCSCGVLPAAAAIRKQGASKGATAAFLISTPESGVDSIAVSWALLDPIMTVARPVVAFVTALVAGISENVLSGPKAGANGNGSLSCAVDECCDGEDCPPEEHRNHHSPVERMAAGMKYAFGELWGDLAGWFLAGMLLAGVITVVVPDEFMTAVLGGGIGAMLLMLVVGVPLYICATASTPIAAALILKGVSPGAALVFLLVGPATNAASLSVLLAILGKRATALYLGSIAVVSVAAGLALDAVYRVTGVEAQAVLGQAGEVVPIWLQAAGALVLAALSIRPLAATVTGWWRRIFPGREPAPGCSSQCCGS